MTSGIVSIGQKTIPGTPIMAILSKQNYGFARVEVEGVKMGQNGVCDGLIQKITSGIVSTGQKTIPDTPIMSILSIQNYGVTRGKRGLKGVKRGL